MQIVEVVDPFDAEKRAHTAIFPVLDLTPSHYEAAVSVKNEASDKRSTFHESRNLARWIHHVDPAPTHSIAEIQIPIAIDAGRLWK
jgi:hypothetical protein